MHQLERWHERNSFDPQEAARIKEICINTQNVAFDRFSGVRPIFKVDPITGLVILREDYNERGAFEEDSESEEESKTEKEEDDDDDDDDDEDIEMSDVGPLQEISDTSSDDPNDFSPTQTPKRQRLN